MKVTVTTFSSLWDDLIAVFEIWSNRVPIDAIMIDSHVERQVVFVSSKGIFLDPPHRSGTPLGYIILTSYVTIGIGQLMAPQTSSSLFEHRMVNIVLMQLIYHLPVVENCSKHIALEANHEWRSRKTGRVVRSMFGNETLNLQGRISGNQYADVNDQIGNQ